VSTYLLNALNLSCLDQALEGLQDELSLLADVLCILQDWRPWQIALLACVLAFVTAQVLAWASRVRVAVRDRGVLQTVFDGLKSLPIVNGIVRDQQEKLVVRT